MNTCCRNGTFLWLWRIATTVVINGSNVDPKRIRIYDIKVNFFLSLPSPLNNFPSKKLEREQRKQKNKYIGNIVFSSTKLKIMKLDFVRNIYGGEYIKNNDCNLKWKIKFWNLTKQTQLTKGVIILIR